MFWIPKAIYLVTGNGLADEGQELLAFDRALQAARIADYNHLRVSSIVPPGCTIYQRAPEWPAGMLVPTVYSVGRGEAGKTIAACLALAVCDNPKKNGMIFEVSMCVQSDESQSYPPLKAIAEQKALTMAKTAMEDRKLNIREIYLISIDVLVPPQQCGCVVAAAVME